jgi:hypothetical protein
MKEKEGYLRERRSFSPFSTDIEKKIIVFEWCFSKCGQFAANDAVLISFIQSVATLWRVS